MEVRPVGPVAFENRNAGIPRNALDMLRGYNSEATGTAGLDRREGNETGQTDQVSSGGAAKPESQDAFARRTGLVGRFIDTHA
jgi:hypothetical protein